MGLSKIIWINEEPIREKFKKDFQSFFLEAKYQKSSSPFDQDLSTDMLTFCELFGKEIMDICLTGRENGERSFLNHNGCIKGSFDVHSNDIKIYRWDGEILDWLNPKEVDLNNEILNSDKNSGFVHFPISRKEQNRIVSTGISAWENPIQQKGKYSIYNVYQDYTNRFTYDKNKAPNDKFGKAFLNLMFSDWNRSIGIDGMYPVISKVYTAYEMPNRILVWKRNCLRDISEFNKEEIQKIIEMLNS